MVKLCIGQKLLELNVKSSEMYTKIPAVLWYLGQICIILYFARSGSRVWLLGDRPAAIPLTSQRKYTLCDISFEAPEVYADNSVIFHPSDDEHH